MQTLRNFVQNEEGATMVEYGLMLALIAVVCLIAVGVVGTETDLTFDAVGTSLQNANAS
jgi:pilus assembly protein Flp/PilA